MRCIPRRPLQSCVNQAYHLAKAPKIHPAPEMPNTVYVTTRAVRYYISYCDGPQDGLLAHYTGSFNWKYGAVRNAGKPSHRITVHDAQAKLSFGSFKKSWRC